ncbi:CopD family protein [Idiomarina piscisalsi]|uniref:CopD family protein n=1 Tax=Idiomarina piscisalsi TaxID=1096243 RepID=UPI0026EE99C2|nr:CopD family protein [Idiomarina piscisalsi]
MYGSLLLLHILAATIWTGGHIVLSVAILPRVLKERSPQLLLNFESAYEKIGMPALIVQIITGIMLAYRLLPDIGQWFNIDNPVAYPIIAKLILLALTAGFAISARFRVIPNLSPANHERHGLSHCVSYGYFYPIRCCRCVFPHWLVLLRKP